MAGYSVAPPSSWRPGSVPDREARDLEGVRIGAGQHMPPGQTSSAFQTGVPARPVATAGPESPLTLGELERRHILRVLDEVSGNRERAAAILGIAARTLYCKLREYESGQA